MITYLMIFIGLVITITITILIGINIFFFLKKRKLIRSGKACILCNGSGRIFFPKGGYGTCPQCNGKGWYENIYLKKKKVIRKR